MKDWNKYPIIFCKNLTCKNKKCRKLQPVKVESVEQRFSIAEFKDCEFWEETTNEI